MSEACRECAMTLAERDGARASAAHWHTQYEIQRSTNGQVLQRAEHAEARRRQVEDERDAVRATVRRYATARYAAWHQEEDGRDSGVIWMAHDQALTALLALVEVPDEQP